jgi:hypothetical protein
MAKEIPSPGLATPWLEICFFQVLQKGFCIQSNLLRFRLFPAKELVIFHFQRHQRKVAMVARFSSGWPEESKEIKTEAKEFAFWVKTLDLKNQGIKNQAAFAKGQRKNR